MNPLRLACCLASVALAATGCTTPDPAPAVPVIGVLAPLTGPDAGAGTEALRGAQLAVEMINESDPPVSAGGGRLVLATADTAGSVDRAAVATAALIADRHVAGLVMADSAEVAAATGSQLQRLRVPLIDAHNTADYLTELGLDWYFRTSPSDSRLEEGAFALLEKQPRSSVARIALVTEPGGDSAGAVVRIRQLAARTGGAVVTQQELSGPEDGRLGPQLDGKRPQVVFAWAHTVEGARTITRSVALLKLPTALFGLGPGFRRLEQPHSARSPLMRPVPWSAELSQRSPVGRQVAERYERRFGTPMTAAAVDTFTGVTALAAAIGTAGSDDPAVVRTALRQTSLPAIEMIMPWDGLRFGPDGQNRLAGVVIEQWQDAAFRLVSPAEVASVPARWNGTT